LTIGPRRRKQPSSRKGNAYESSATHTGRGSDQRTDSQDQPRATAPTRSTVARSLGWAPRPPAMPLGRRSGIRSSPLGLPISCGFRPGRGLPRLLARANWPRNGLALVWATTGRGRILAPLRLPGVAIRLAVSRSQGNFEIIDLIPLRVGTIALGDREKLTEPATRILGG